MKLQYLGTGAAEGWPGLFCRCEACREARRLGGKNIRTRAQSLVDDSLLIDFPPDAYLHVLQNGMDLGGIGGLLITHTHHDHFCPLDIAMRGEPFAHTPGLPPLTVYGGQDAETLFAQAMTETFGENAPKAALRFERLYPLRSVQTVTGHTVTALPANHGSCGMECFLYLIEKEGKRLFYANDSGWYPEETWQFLKGKSLDLVSFDTTSGPGEVGAQGHHMGLQDNIRAAERFRALGCVSEGTRLVANHFSHNGKALHEALVALGAHHGIDIAYDGCTVAF